MVSDGIHDGVGVQTLAKHVFGGFQRTLARSGNVLHEDWRAGEAEEVVFLESLGDGGVHVAKLRAVALVEYHDHLLAVDVVVGVLLDEVGELLYGGDDDAALAVVQLLFQFLGRGVAVGSALLESVVLLHRLVVEVFSIHHKQYLFYVRQFGSELCRLEGGEGLARACGVPYVAASVSCAVEFGVVGYLYLVEQFFGGCYLVWAHHHQNLLVGEDAKLGEDVQQGVAGKEGSREVLQIAEHLVLGICPVAGKLKRVAGLLPWLLALLGLFPDMTVSGSVAIVLGLRAVADHKNLHVLVERAPCPERFPAVAVYLVEGFLQAHASAFQFDVNQGQTIHEDGHVIAVWSLAVVNLVLIDYLGVVVVRVLLVDEVDVFLRAIVEGESLDVVTLYGLCLINNTLTLVGDFRLKETLPLVVGKVEVVEFLELLTKILYQLVLVVDMGILVALSL